MKTFQQYLKESKAYNQALTQYHQSTPTLTGQGLQARTHRNPKNILTHEKLAIRQQIEKA